MLTMMLFNTRLADILYFIKLFLRIFVKIAYFGVMSVLDLVLSHNVRSCILKISLCRIDWTKLCLRIQVSPECTNNAC